MSRLEVKRCVVNCLISLLSNYVYFLGRDDWRQDARRINQDLYRSSSQSADTITKIHGTAHSLFHIREVAAVVRSIQVIKVARAKQIMIDVSVARKSIFAHRHRRGSVCNQFRLENRSLMLSCSFFRDARSNQYGDLVRFVSAEENISERREFLLVSFVWYCVIISFKAYKKKMPRVS